MNQNEKREKTWAQQRYEKHVAELRRLHVPEPIKNWDELTRLVQEVWEKRYPEIDNPKILH